jgi:hypothetical protein
MIGLQDQQIVTLARQDLLGNRALAAHRARVTMLFSRANHL